MADNIHVNGAEHALRVLEAVHEDEPALASDELSPEAIERIRVAIDRALDQAWAQIRAQAAAEASATKKPRRSFATWTRDRIITRLAELQRAFGGNLQLAHRKLVDLSDQELRLLLADVEDAAARHGGGAA